MEWFYSGVGGIRQDENSMAFNKIRIEPEVVGDLTFAKTEYDSAYGKITTDWKKSANEFELDVNIPVNTTAVVYLPAPNNQTVSEVNNSIFKSLGYKNGKAIVAIGSGNYKFKVK